MKLKGQYFKQVPSQRAKIELFLQSLKKYNHCIRNKLHSYFIPAGKKPIILMLSKTLYYLHYPSLENGLAWYFASPDL